MRKFTVEVKVGIVEPVGRSSRPRRTGAVLIRCRVRNTSSAELEWSTGTLLKVPLKGAGRLGPPSERQIGLGRSD